jgi:hypothetical protein
LGGPYVIPVRDTLQRPVLLASLVARAEGPRPPPPRYAPQRHALRILDLGGGVGLATRGRWWLPGSAALHLKRAIDRRWLRQFW